MTVMSETATVELLTAEVRVLQVGRRQITLSVYRQLDSVTSDEIEPFGRVADIRDPCVGVRVVGRHRRTGALVRGGMAPADYYQGTPNEEDARSLWREWTALPLIVLAGLQ
jgi:hypothetical protein